MKDPWIRGGEGWWLHSPQKAEVYDMTVNQLMIDGERRWDVHKIQHLFFPKAAGRILSVNLFQNVREDKFIWEGGTDGKYTVKAGYRLIMNEAWKKGGSFLNRNWSVLWDISAPPKTRHLVWRVCQGCIPIRNQLLQRQVECGASCPLCNEENETEFHIFFTCPQVLTSWEAAGLGHVVLNRLQNFNNAADLLFDVCSQEHTNTAGIWQNRNDVVWNNNQLSPIQVGWNAFNAWQAWFSANNTHSSSQQDAHRANNSQWMKPNQGWIKINVDAAFFKDRGTSTWVLVIIMEFSFVPSLGGSTLC
jgi:hypothetical protein